VVLRYVDDLDYDEVAAVLGRPPATVRSQVHRGLALLRAAHDAASRKERSA
jgi:DNA-directed RNA polymerase specialized sigma24 family protein